LALDTFGTSGLKEVVEVVEEVEEVEEESVDTFEDRLIEVIGGASLDVTGQAK